MSCFTGDTGEVGRGFSTGVKVGNKFLKYETDWGFESGDEGVRVGESIISSLSYFGFGFGLGLGLRLGLATCDDGFVTVRQLSCTPSCRNASCQQSGNH